MRNIDKFILHVTHNLFPLNEYTDKEVNVLMTKFREEADDLNIQISDEKIKEYIERFDQLKNSPKVTDKDLRKYSLSKLIKLVRSMPGVDKPTDEPEDDTPDVVYNDNGITIWNGAKQGNCITYGAGENWCITRPGGSYWGQYRYGSSYKYPTFYLAKNTNLSDSDKLSFVALQVLDNGEYKFTNRNNSPGMEGPFSWEELNSRIPWLRDIPNIKNILKYIPISKSEMAIQVYKHDPISIKQWIKEPFETKRQYLNVRSGNNLFKDITNDLFISKYLPQFPQIATMIAGTAGIIDIKVLMQYLDKFSKQDQLSIAKQIRNKFSLDIFNQDISFDLKKYLVKTDKISLTSDQRIYVTKDNQAIVLLTLGDNIRIGLYTEDDDYPNIKLNKRTAKYLLEYPELDKIPLRNLLKLAEDEIIDKGLIDSVLNKAKEDPNSAIIVKETEVGDIILDSNTFSSYKIGTDGKITAIPFDNEEVQQLFTSAKDNEGFQQNALNIFKTRENIPETIDKKSLASVVNSIPYSQRILQFSNQNPAVLLTSTDESIPFFLMDTTPRNAGNYISSLISYNDRGVIQTYGSIFTDATATSYFAYLRQINKSFNDSELRSILNSSVNADAKKAFVRNNPPVNANNTHKAVIDNTGTVYLIDTQNPRESLQLSNARNNLKRASISTPTANQLLGQPAQAPGQAAAQANDAVRARRGRPAGVPNAPRPQQAAAPAEGAVGIGDIFQNAGIPAALTNNFPIRNWPRNWLPGITVGNRGVARRQNLIGGRGRVNQVYESGQSAIYNIRLNNNTNVLSVVIQPGNSHFLIIQNTLVRLDSPANLLQALQQRNLAEIHRYIVNEYFDRNPKHISEFKQMLRKHINEKNNQTMNKSKLKEVIRQLVDKVLAEAETAPSKPKPTEKPGPAVAPGKPGEKKEPNRRKIGNPNVKPAPKAMNEEEMLNKIVARFKSKK